MAIQLRLFLILGCVLTLLFFLSKINKSKLKINHSIFWIVFGFVLLILAVIPESIFQISYMLGFQSPVNLLYLVIIFLLVVKLFTNTMKISRLNEQVAALTQDLAIYKLDAAEAAQAKKEESHSDPELVSV